MYVVQQKVIVSVIFQTDIYVSVWLIFWKVYGHTGGAPLPPPKKKTHTIKYSCVGLYEVSTNTDP